MWGKKLLLEGSAIGGFGGGVGGWLGNRYGLVEIQVGDEIAILAEGRSITKERPDGRGNTRHNGVVNELDHGVFGSGKYQSEGVEDKLMLVSGWEQSGKHKDIESKKLSQGHRQMWGGRRITNGSQWFGPRDRNKEIEYLEEAKRKMKDKSYWPMIQQAGEYVTADDLRGITEKGNKRDFNLETQILELYQPRKGGEKAMGKVKNDGKVDLEFNLEIIKKILDANEETLKRQKGNYGRLANNGKLSIVRAIGNPESVAGNYFRKYAWGKDLVVKNLREVNLVNTVMKLIAGDEVGFVCGDFGRTGVNYTGEGLFDECKKTDGGAREKYKVKSVLKSVTPNSGNKKVPKRGKGNRGILQEDARQYGGQIYSDEFDKSKVINEKCEPDNILSGLTDLELKIRQEVCDLIIRPGFGEQVSEKRLCLIEATEYKNYLRLSTYLNVLQIPSGHNKNTFGTKCSNYRI